MRAYQIAFSVVSFWLPATTRLMAAEQVHRVQAGSYTIEIVTDTQRLEARFGPRFDSTASVASVKSRDHSFLAPEGLADEFGLEGVGVLGFQEAGTHGTFIKIGVGVLVRDSETKYRFQHAYPVAKRFPVMAEATATTVRVAQVSDSINRCQYRYQKSYSVSPDGTLSIDYALTNLGAAEFTIEQYNHNFFSIDGEGGSDRYTVSTVFPLIENPTGAWHAETNHRLRLSVARASEKGVYWGTTINIDSAFHRMILRHRNGEGVVISGDTPAVRFAIWADRSAICPELFVRRSVAPGATGRWSRYYRFGVPDLAPSIEPSS